MFDVGFWEVSLIFVVALLVVGPEKLPSLARTVGLYVGKARRYADHVRREIDTEVRNAELKELEKETQALADVKEAVQQTGDVLRSEINDDVSTSSPASTPEAVAPATEGHSDAGEAKSP